MSLSSTDFAQTADAAIKEYINDLPVNISTTYTGSVNTIAIFWKVFTAAVNST